MVFEELFGLSVHSHLIPGKINKQLLFKSGSQEAMIAVIEERRENDSNYADQEKI